MIYILYKIFNNIVTLLETRKSRVPLIRTPKDFSASKPGGFLFDFSHSSTHFGDKLFFSPLIYALQIKGIPFKVLGDPEVFEIFEVLYGEKIRSSTLNDDYVCVFPKPSYKDFKGKYDKYILIDFTDVHCESVISEQLVASFSGFFNIDGLVSGIKCKNCSLVSGHLDKNEQYIVFNNYINSGKFRILFLKKNVLIKKALELKKSGFKFVHVGSEDDKLNDRTTYDFIDLDMRGRLSIREVVCLIGDKRVSGVLSYDNFIMHLANIFGKKAWIQFRGRFTKPQVNHHMSHVNCTFLSSGEIEYLN